MKKCQVCDGKCGVDECIKTVKQIQNKSSNSEYAKCSEEIFNKFLYNHDLAIVNKITDILKKHFAYNTIN